MDLASFDPGTFVVAGVSLMAFTFGFVQFIKETFNLEGKKVTLLSVLVGLLVMGVYQVGQFLPAEYIQYYNAGWVTISFGLATSGYYKFATREA